MKASTKDISRYLTTPFKTSLLIQFYKKRFRVTKSFTGSNLPDEETDPRHRTAGITKRNIIIVFS